MKKIIIIFIVIAILCGVGFLVYTNIFETSINIKKSNLEINEDYNTKDIVNIKNGKLIDKEVSFNKLGNNELKIEYENKFGKKTKHNINIKVIDTKSPTIEAEEELITDINKEIDLLENVVVEDNSKEDIKPTIEGEYDFKKEGTYNLKYIAVDSSKNKTEKDFVLKVNKEQIEQKTSYGDYYVKVNKTQNVVMVYAKDSNGKYTKLVKTFLCSAGNDTPVGTFNAGERIETLSLVGGVWGHYTMRIVDAIWFHSVPYFSKPSDGHWNDLEYEEFNKLGTIASKGCIRLSIKDAKWIFDNLEFGTTVEIYEDDKLPEGVTKPKGIKIDINSENKGWDPTDPDPENPWNK